MRRAAVGRVGGELGDVEAQAVEGPQQGVDLVAIGARHGHRVGEGHPQVVVPALEVGADLGGVQRLGDHPAGLQVHELAHDVHGGGLHVVGALAARQRLVQLAGLGVDQVGRERPGIAQEERVGQRAVVPREPEQVQPDDEQDQRVEQPLPRVGAERGLDQRPVGQRERQVAGDQRGRQVLAVGVHPPGDDPHRLDARGAEPAEVEQQLVLALREGLLDLLDREHRPVDAHEPHGVPRDAARHRHGVLGGPLLQGGAPGQEQQVRLRRCGRGAQRHRGSWSVAGAAQ